MTDAPHRALPVLLLAIAAALLVGACNREPPAASDGANATDTAGNLPRPEAGAGSITGMPGARAARDAGTEIAQPDTDSFDMPEFDEDGNPVPGDAIGVDAAVADAGDPADPQAVPAATIEPAPATATEPDADDAAAVVRKYYGAIDARQYAQAYRLWSGNGRSSGQSASSFEGGFADTAGVTVQTGTPGRVEGAAGSRYVRIPVSIRAVQVDGSERRYEGSYTLRRAVVDGASDDQREWRIESADLREAQ